MFKTALLALAILGGAGALAAPVLADNDSTRQWPNWNDGQPQRHDRQGEDDDWRRDWDDDDQRRDWDDDDRWQDGNRRHRSDNQWSNPWWRPGGGQGWYDNNRNRCAAWHGRRLSQRDLAHYLRGFGYRHILNFDRRNDGYSVRAVDRDGRRVRLFVDGRCGRVSRWR